MMRGHSQSSLLTQSQARSAVPFHHATLTRVVMLSFLAFACMPSPLAQSMQPAPTSQPPLTPVDPGQDINPLAVGLRPQRVDLRGPSGFDRLYRVAPGTVIGGVVVKDGGYARISGSTVVVFPRGEYTRVAQGVARADVPPGTMYLQASNIDELIGSPQDRATDARTAPRSGASAAARRPSLGAQPPSSSLPRALNARVGAPGQTLSSSSSQAASSPEFDSTSASTQTSSAISAVPNLWADDAYRQRRISALIEAAFVSQTP